MGSGASKDSNFSQDGHVFHKRNAVVIPKENKVKCTSKVLVEKDDKTHDVKACLQNDGSSRRQKTETSITNNEDFKLGNRHGKDGSCQTRKGSLKYDESYKSKVTDNLQKQKKREVRFCTDPVRVHGRINHLLLRKKTNNKKCAEVYIRSNRSVNSEDVGTRRHKGVPSHHKSRNTLAGDGFVEIELKQTTEQIRNKQDAFPADKRKVHKNKIGPKDGFIETEEVKEENANDSEFWEEEQEVADKDFAGSRGIYLNPSNCTLASRDEVPAMVTEHSLDQILKVNEGRSDQLATSTESVTCGESMSENKEEALRPCNTYTVLPHSKHQDVQPPDGHGVDHKPPDGLSVDHRFKHETIHHARNDDRSPNADTTVSTRKNTKTTENEESREPTEEQSEKVNPDCGYQAQDEIVNEVPVFASKTYTVLPGIEASTKHKPVVYRPVFPYEELRKIAILNMQEARDKGQPVSDDIDFEVNKLLEKTSFKGPPAGKQETPAEFYERMQNNTRRVFNSTNYKLLRIAERHKHQARMAFKSMSPVPGDEEDVNFNAAMRKLKQVNIGGITMYVPRSPSESSDEDECEGYGCTRTDTNALRSHVTVSEADVLQQLRREHIISVEDPAKHRQRRSENILNELMAAGLILNQATRTHEAEQESEDAPTARPKARPRRLSSLDTWESGCSNKCLLTPRLPSVDESTVQGQQVTDAAPEAKTNDTRNVEESHSDPDTIPQTTGPIQVHSEVTSGAGRSATGTCMSTPNNLDQQCGLLGSLQEEETEAEGQQHNMNETLAMAYGLEMAEVKETENNPNYRVQRNRAVTKNLELL